MRTTIFVINLSLSLVFCSLAPSPRTDTIICINSPNSYNNDVENNGDLICAAHAHPSKEDFLVVRDTVINYEDELSLHYTKDFSDIIVSTVNVLNFGRQHAFTTSVNITNEVEGNFHKASVDVEIKVPENEEVRLFVEVYGRWALDTTPSTWETSEITTSAWEKISETTTLAWQPIEKERTTTTWESTETDSSTTTWKSTDTDSTTSTWELTETTTSTWYPTGTTTSTWEPTDRTPSPSHTTSTPITGTTPTWHPTRTTTATWESTETTTSIWFPTDTIFPSTTTTTGTPSTITPPQTETIICRNSPNSHSEDVENYGDLICAAHAHPSKEDVLVLRDTVINYENELSLHYTKEFTNVMVSTVNVLNFGRQHAFTTFINITNEVQGWYNVGTVDVEIKVPADEEVRLFVEVYGREY